MDHRLLDNEMDHSSTLRVLDSDDKEVGQLTCEVTALSLLQTVEDGKPEHQASTRATAVAAAMATARHRSQAAGVTATAASAEKATATVKQYLR